MPTITYYKPLVSFIIPWYKSILIAVPSLLAQTYENIECIVVHDGEPPEKYIKMIESFDDNRVKLIHTAIRSNNGGHTPRDFGIDYVSSESKYIVFTGADNYYYPSFTKEMIGGFLNEEITSVFCNCTHNYLNWNVLNVALRWGDIDCGCFMTKTEIAKKIRWKGTHHSADWDFIEEIMKTYGTDKMVKLDRHLFVHN